MRNHRDKHKILLLDPISPHNKMIDTEASLVERSAHGKGLQLRLTIRSTPNKRKKKKKKIDPSQECDKEPRRHKTLLGCMVITSREGREIQPARGPGRLHPCSGSTAI